LGEEVKAATQGSEAVVTAAAGAAQDSEAVEE
jgi:hypothetical protein